MGSIISLILTGYSLILLARVLLSWFPNVDPRNPIVVFIYQVTEPVLAPIRQMLPPMAGMDFSPLIVLVLIRVIQTLFRF
jgi:YggT family protein